MSIQDKAAEVIARCIPPVGQDDPRIGDPAAVARRLHEEGLLREDTELNRLRRELETMRGWAESLGTGRPGGPQVAQKITNIIDQEEK